MKENIDNLISRLNRNDAPTERDYTNFLQKIDFVIDSGFKDFIRSYDGAEGEINGEDFIILWNIEDLLALNPYYKGIDECKNLFFFGTDGSNLGFAFDKKTGFVVSIDFLEIAQKEPNKMASSFGEFLERFLKNDK